MLRSFQLCRWSSLGLEEGASWVALGSKDKVAAAPLHHSLLSSPSTCSSTSALGLGSFPLGAATKTRQVDFEFADPGAGRACVVARAQQLGGRGQVAAEPTCGCLDRELRAGGQVRGAAVGSERKPEPTGRKQSFTSSQALGGSSRGVSPGFPRWRGGSRRPLCSAAPADLRARSCSVWAACSAGRC